MHIVTFTKSLQIAQIRLFWDQGSLLKSVEVVGSRGKNWPLREGKDQIRTVTASIDNALTGVMNGVSLDEQRSGRSGTRGGANSQTNIQLFSPRSNAREESPANSVAPRASAKPPSRDPSELFSDGLDPVDVQSRERSLSPTKQNPRKAGAGKNYGDIRLFDNTPLDPSDPLSPERQRKGHPKQYAHFEFGEEPLNIKAENRKSKHSTQWGFEDFTTPQKPRARPNPGQQRNIDWLEDEEGQKHEPARPRARKDAEHQFEFEDDATPRPAGAERVRPKDTRSGLYEDHVNLGDPSKNSSATTAGAEAGDKMPLGNITNVNAKGHKKNFSSQFDMTDDSPSRGGSVEGEGKRVPEPLKKVAKTMESNWSMYDDSPTTAEKKHKGIQISGDGMGGRKAKGEKSWWEYE